MHFIDSHCHIDAPDFDDDREEMLQRAADAGITEMIVVGASGNLAQAQATVDFASNRPGVYATVGIHPHHAGEVEESWWPQFCALAARPEVVAVGETGLDFHYDNSPRDVQAKRFEDHIELAATLGKPLICHIRDAHDEATEILKRSAAGRVETIIHCFTGNPVNAQNYVDLGFYISFSGIVSFKGKSTRPVRDSVAVVPHQQLLIETDCPYLAPVPMRGKRNEPAFLIETAKVVAAEAGLELAELAALTAANTRRVFGLSSA